jgi:heme/copper-type cytochrome/quinol oxidase subunit 2
MISVLGGQLSSSAAVSPGKNLQYPLHVVVVVVVVIIIIIIIIIIIYFSFRASYTKPFRLA